MQKENGYPQEPMITIVVPAHNEALVIASTMRQLVQWRDEQDLCAHIIIVENGSTDDTYAIAKEMASQNPNVSVIQSTSGKAQAILTGWLYAPAEVLMFIDADLSPSPTVLTPLLSAINKGADLACADRFLITSSVTRSRTRSLVSMVWARIVSMSLPLPFQDYQCGAKALRGEWLSWVIQNTKDRSWFFDTELLAMLRLKQVSIVRVPVCWKEDTISDRHSTLPITRTSFQFLRALFALRSRLRSHRSE